MVRPATTIHVKVVVIEVLAESFVGRNDSRSRQNPGRLLFVRKTLNCNQDIARRRAICSTDEVPSKFGRFGYLAYGHNHAPELKADAFLGVVEQYGPGVFQAHTR